MRAQVDVYDLIMKKAAREFMGDASQLHCVADTGQSADRGGCRCDGSIPTTTSSTSLYSFAMHRFIDPPELHRMHGFDGYNFCGLSKQEALSLVGNGMVPTSVAIVLVPVLKHLGFLEK